MFIDLFNTKSYTKYTSKANYTQKIQAQNAKKIN